MTRAGRVPVVVIAGAASGVGKTTAALEAPPGAARPCEVREPWGGPAREQGCVVGGALARCMPLHFGSNPGLAAHFVSACGRRP
jgi:cobyrinic acid a,c-diamide synthase